MLSALAPGEAHCQESATSCPLWYPSSAQAAVPGDQGSSLNALQLGQGEI